MTECPGCGDEWQRIGQHWWGQPSHRPSFTQEQEEIITGILMGDGCIARDGKNPRLVIECVEPAYIDWLSEKFGPLAHSRQLVEMSDENHQDKHRLHFVRNPAFEKWAEWYDGGSKEWPDIELTPTILTHLYAGDGHWKNTGGDNYISIGASNEMENKKKISNMFHQAELPEPTWHSWSMAWSVTDSKELWAYMVDAPPGYEYKWPSQNRNSV